MPPVTSFRELYDAHVRFVWRALARLGVGEPDLPDASQEVFVVAHRRLAEFEGRSKVTTWLFAICMRVASDRRNLAHHHRELPTGKVPDLAHDGADASVLVERHRARQMLEQIMDRMPEEQRVVFALFELEELIGDEIAELLDVPVGTVRSRLRLARATFEEAVLRHQASVRRPGQMQLATSEVFR